MVLGSTTGMARMEGIKLHLARFSSKVLFLRQIEISNKFRLKGRVGKGHLLLLMVRQDHRDPMGHLDPKDPQEVRDGEDRVGQEDLVGQTLQVGVATSGHLVVEAVVEMISQRWLLSWLRSDSERKRTE